MSLVINMNEVARQSLPVKVSGTIDTDERFKGSKEVIRVSPLRMSGKAHAGSDVVEIKGEAEADLVFTCSRCLEPYERTLRFPLHEVFSRDREITEAEGNEHIQLVDGDEVDLNPIALENLVLHLPFIPICEDDCEGLCTQCGQNLNEGTCGCSAEKIDPRLEGLKDFFNK